MLACLCFAMSKLGSSPAAVEAVFLLAGIVVVGIVLLAMCAILLR
jgi:hypothetical protein